MASTQTHVISYVAKNFTEIIGLLDCFVSSISNGTVSEFQTTFINDQWEATVTFRGRFEDAIACRIPIGFNGRIECVYNPELQVPSALSTDYKCWVNGEEVFVDTVVLLTATETLRLTLQSLPFSAGDVVLLSFCNSQGMNVSSQLCMSFFKKVVINNLV